MEKVIQLRVEKYLDTDIDELVIEFEHDSKPAVFDTFEIPKDIKAIISYEILRDTGKYCWIGIANPRELQKSIINKNVNLPKIQFEFDGVEQTFERFLKDINLDNY